MKAKRNAFCMKYDNIAYLFLLPNFLIFFIFILLMFTACEREHPGLANSANGSGTEGTARQPEENEEDPDDEDPIIEFVPLDPEEMQQLIEELELMQITENTLVTNSYFGISFVLPEAWFFWYMDEYAVNSDPSLTTDINRMTIETDEITGERFIDFFELGSGWDEFLSEHLALSVRAVDMEGKTLEEYIAAFRELNTRSPNVSLMYEGDIEIGETEFKRMVFYIENAENEFDNRIMETFILERNGYAIKIRFDGWAVHEENERQLLIYMSYYVLVHE